MSLQEILNNISKFFINDRGDLNILGKILWILLLYIAYKIVFKIISSLTDKHLNNEKVQHSENFARQVTVTRLLKKIIQVVLLIILITTILDTLGVNTSAIIGTLGIGSVALGIGAQSLMKDFINGFFIVIENQFSVGDLVEISGNEGIVESIGVRVTTLRGFDGNLYIIPNGTIQTATNKHRGSQRARVDVRINRDVLPEVATKLIEDAISPMKEYGEIVDGPRIMGITENTINYYTVSVVAFSTAGEQFKTEYEIRKRILEIATDEDLTPAIKIRR